MESKTAIIAGASGLIGRSLIQKLLSSDQYGQVIALVRSSLGIQHEKLQEVKIDFDELLDISDFPQEDDVVCCLGTTQAKSKNEENYRKVDYHYCYNLAQRALKEGADRFFLISSLGAKKGSKNFYLNLKGELEHDISFLDYRTIYIFRPSLLRGDRKENRPGEKFAQLITRIIPFIGPWKKYKPIHADQVADAIMQVSRQEDKGCYFYESEIMRKM